MLMARFVGAALVQLGAALYLAREVREPEALDARWSWRASSGRWRGWPWRSWDSLRVC